MKFNVLVAIFAIAGLAGQANAYSDGTLRTATQVAQNDTEVVTESQPAQGVVILNSNSNTAATSTTQATVQQPVTVVEAAPVSESKAESMRKARQGEEVKTEQKIVEKLEESRLKEEQQRAERLFGNKLEAAPAAAVAAPIAPALIAEPKEEKATQVTIEKVEIIQPAPILKEEKIEAAPISSKMEIKEAKEEGKDKFFVGAMLAAPNYNTKNVKTNYGLGASVGINLKSNWSVEASFLYSNHTVDSYWNYQLFRDLDQYDISGSAKYYILSGRLKPYVGGSVTYVYRKYQDRVYDVYGGGGSAALGWNDQETHAVNAGLLGGVDFMISESIMIGGGLDYNFNVMNKTEFPYQQYGMAGGTRPLEEVDYYTLKISAKMTF